MTVYRRSRKGPLSDNMLTLSLIGGVIGGIAIAHIFRSQVNAIWSDIPYLNKIPASNYSVAYMGGHGGGHHGKKHHHGGRGGGMMGGGHHGGG